MRHRSLRNLIRSASMKGPALILDVIMLSLDVRCARDMRDFGNGRQRSACQLGFARLMSHLNMPTAYKVAL